MISPNAIRRPSLVLVATLVLVVIGCRSGAPSSQGGQRTPSPTRGELTTVDAATLYRAAGLLAASGPVAFVGTIAHFASAVPDTTLSMLTLSMPTHSLSFIREGSHYRASYNVHATLQRGTTVIREINADEVVRVGSSRETARSEESVVFQEYVRLPPGSYTVSVVVRDEVTSRSGSAEGTVAVPAIPARGLSSLLPIFEADSRTALDSLPHIIASPRSTAVFGRDSIVIAYIEAYQPQAGEQLFAAVKGDGGTVLWRDTIPLPTTTAPLATVAVRIPVSPVGIGSVRVVLWRRGLADTSVAPLFISFGEELPVASFEDMLSYLRFYATQQRLKVLRDTPPEGRASAWASFLRETDPTPATPQHEGLQAYFGRIQLANDRFHEEGGPGWLTDRGMVLVALGDPDFIREPIPTEINMRNATIAWEYQRFRVQLQFIDRSGLGRWQLTTSSELEFQSILRREQVK